MSAQIELATGGLLAVRRRTHGEFAAVALLCQQLLAPLRAQPGWPLLSVPRRAALEMIAVKTARLLCGDPDHSDHWRDIAGYAALGQTNGDAAEDWPAPTHVVGFFFDTERRRVWLVRKQRPEWQKGRLNGIGGKIEPGETALDAIVREFAEETGYRLAPERWEEIVRLDHRARDGVIAFFRAVAVSDDEFVIPHTVTDEPIHFFPVLDILSLRTDVLPGLRVEIPIALDTSGIALPVLLQDGMIRA